MHRCSGSDLGQSGSQNRRRIWTTPPCSRISHSRTFRSWNIRPCPRRTCCLARQWTQIDKCNDTILAYFRIDRSDRFSDCQHIRWYLQMYDRSINQVTNRLSIVNFSYRCKCFSWEIKRNRRCTCTWKIHSCWCSVRYCTFRCLGIHRDL